MEFQLFTGKNVEEAITNAVVSLGVTSDRIEYNIVDKGSNGFLGIGSKPAKINARIKDETEKKDIVKKDVAKKEEASSVKVSTEEKSEAVKKENTESAATAVSAEDVEKAATEFLSKVFDAMNLVVKIDIKVMEDCVNIDLVGDDMGVLIGKRGQTLDSLQYLVSLVINKKSDKYLRVKLDTENYRERRKETLENLAKNIAFKVKRTKRPVSLEPMNPYERRVIHSALQNDRYVTTKSEGEEPYRHVVVLLKK